MRNQLNPPDLQTGAADQSISTQSLRGLADYIQLYRKLIQDPPRMDRTLRIAVLSSFTLSGIKETIYLKCLEAGIQADLYVGGYNQIAQETHDPKSGLYAFDPSLVIIFLDTRSILGELYLNPYSISAADRRRWCADQERELTELLTRIKDRSTGKILLHNFEVPTHSPLGILESKQDFGFHESLEALNAALRAAARNDPRIFLFDYDQFCSRLGKRQMTDPKMYYLGDIKLGFDHVADLASAYLSYLKPLAGLSRKCAVVDLDNTLWGGVLGEEGIEGIKLGPAFDGKPYYEFQKHLLALHQRGVILALSSKNNREEAMRAISTHPSMILKPEHFSAVRIDWQNKADQLKSIAQELNLGLDSLVFIDDDARERDLVRRLLPEVLVVDLPEDSSLYPEILSQIDDFNTLQITSEDLQKGRYYSEQRARQNFATQSKDLNDYLRSLAMTVRIEPGGRFTIPRMAQLVLKTNQFNLTTRRYPEEKIEAFVQDPRMMIFAINVEDRFGDNGITGMAIVERGSVKWRVDTFLLSCRVIGRRIEESMLAYIAARAKQGGARALVGEFIPSPKNELARHFYSKQGFEPAGDGDESERWEFDLAKPYAGPEFIRVMEPTHG